MLVSSVFNNPSFAQKRHRAALLSIPLKLVGIALPLSLLTKAITFDNSVFIALFAVFVVAGAMMYYRYALSKKNRLRKNQIDRIELATDRIIIFNFRKEAIEIAHNLCRLIPVDDEVVEWGRHITDLRLMMLSGAEYYIDASLFNTHQIEDWKSPDGSKRYYSV